MKNKVIILIIALFLFNCSISKLSPPKIDLSTGGRIGVITFKVENARGVLDEIATEILVGHMKQYYEKSEIILLGKAGRSYVKRVWIRCIYKNNGKFMQRTKT
ncbi:MAG: hypothetical protein KAR14_00240 [Candidatus Aminicenantes bacterium]|nr:hypothetical protein [Candidatus Aminicenantes bacterium]